jgi:hypothetical protein
LKPRARELPLEGLTTGVAHIDDIIRSKESAGRDKDLAGLPLLRTLRRTLERRGET